MNKVVCNVDSLRTKEIHLKKCAATRGMNKWKEKKTRNTLVSTSKAIQQRSTEVGLNWYSHFKQFLMPTLHFEWITLTFNPLCNSNKSIEIIHIQ